MAPGTVIDVFEGAAPEKSTVEKFREYKAAKELGAGLKHFGSVDGFGTSSATIHAAAKAATERRLALREEKRLQDLKDGKPVEKNKFAAAAPKPAPRSQNFTRTPYVAPVLDQKSMDIKNQQSSFLTRLKEKEADRVSKEYALKSSAGSTFDTGSSGFGNGPRGRGRFRPYHELFHPENIAKMMSRCCDAPKNEKDKQKVKDLLLKGEDILRQQKEKKEELKQLQMEAQKKNKKEKVKKMSSVSKHQMALDYSHEFGNSVLKAIQNKNQEELQTLVDKSENDLLTIKHKLQCILYCICNEAVNSNDTMETFEKHLETASDALVELRKQHWLVSSVELEEERNALIAKEKNRAERLQRENMKKQSSKKKRNVRATIEYIMTSDGELVAQNQEETCEIDFFERYNKVLNDIELIRETELLEGSNCLIGEGTSFLTILTQFCREAGWPTLALLELPEGQVDDEFDDWKPLDNTVQKNISVITKRVIGLWEELIAKCIKHNVLDLESLATWNAMTSEPLTRDVLYEALSGHEWKKVTIESKIERIYQLVLSNEISYDVGLQKFIIETANLLDPEEGSKIWIKGCRERGIEILSKSIDDDDLEVDEEEE